MALGQNSDFSKFQFYLQLKKNIQPELEHFSNRISGVNLTSGINLFKLYSTKYNQI